MSDIDLGFPEQREAAWLTNRYFPSKVGGRPAWLELEALPAKEKLQCDSCKFPKTFLCQIYAPYDGEHNFHRSIYVFVCRSATCQEANSARNLTALRSQLPKTNSFYSAQPPPEEGKPLPPIPAKKKLCLACGSIGPLSCSRCKKASYCTAQHQRAHWPHHKQLCKAETAITESHSAALLPEVSFPEWEIVIEPYEEESGASKDESDDDDELKEKQRLDEFAKLAAEGKTGELKDVPDTELEKYADSAEAVDDKHFRKFKKEVGKDPEQILRYRRNGEPLWIADTKCTVAEQLKIPNCEHCAGPRQFEFQIMPQLLLLLKEEHIDWGVVAIYTCAASCKPPKDNGYLDEYVVKQDIVAEKP